MSRALAITGTFPACKSFQVSPSQHCKAEASQFVATMCAGIIAAALQLVTQAAVRSIAQASGQSVHAMSWTWWLQDNLAYPCQDDHGTKAHTALAHNKPSAGSFQVSPATEWRQRHRLANACTPTLHAMIITVVALAYLPLTPWH